MIYETTDALFTGICDKIRAKDGTAALIRHQDIPERIAAISGGGGETFTSPFYTYDGGGMKIEDGVASNFALLSCVYLGKAFRPLDKTWEIRTKFKTPTYWKTKISTLFSSQIHRGSVQCDFEVQDGVRKMWSGMSGNGGSSWSHSVWSDYEFELDKWYWMKYIFDGEKYAILISVDGTDYKEIGVINYSGQFYQPESNNSFIFGGSRTIDNVFDGSIDLKETYIKIGDEIWWGREKA